VLRQESAGIGDGAERPVDSRYDAGSENGHGKSSKVEEIARQEEIGWFA